MKFKCTKCEIVDSLEEEDVKLLAHVIKRYNLKPDPTDYVKVLNIIKGNSCKDGGKHVYVFDESFDKEIADTIQEFNNTLAVQTIRKENITKFEHSIVDIIGQIKSLKTTLDELEKKKECTLAEISAGELLIQSIKLKFEKLTGVSDMLMWS